jgi:hypothetical protein
MYPTGYYYQPVPPPPGFDMNQGIIPMQHQNIIYTDYMHPPMIPVQTFGGKNILEPSTPADMYQPEGKSIRLYAISLHI